MRMSRKVRTPTATEVVDGIGAHFDVDERFVRAHTHLSEQYGLVEIDAAAMREELDRDLEEQHRAEIAECLGRELAPIVAAIGAGSSVAGGSTCESAGSSTGESASGSIGEAKRSGAADRSTAWVAAENSRMQVHRNTEYGMFAAGSPFWEKTRAPIAADPLREQMACLARDFGPENVWKTMWPHVARAARRGLDAWIDVNTI